MRFQRIFACLVAAMALSALPAQTPAPPSKPQPAEAQAIRGVLERSAADWNRGDLDAFATSYENSPDILFIGRTTHRGYADMLATYKANYGTSAKRGTLSFSQLEVQPLDARFATVTGRFHLERTAAGGSNANGYFLLVFENTAKGWKIVRDDTTDLPAAASK
jgi:ketosteroid isomerase-like protein